MLIGDYSGNMRPDASAYSGTDRSAVISRHAISTVRRDGGTGPVMLCIQGDYSANVSCESIYSGR